jgi:hypothetical protein
MLEAVEQQSYDLYRETLSTHGIDYLKSFPELNDYTVLAADTASSILTRLADWSDLNRLKEGIVRHESLQLSVKNGGHYPPN